MEPLEDKMSKNRNNIYKVVVKNIALGSFLAGNCPEWIASVQAAAPQSISLEERDSAVALTMMLTNILLNHFFNGAPLDRNAVRELLAGGADAREIIGVIPQAEKLIDETMAGMNQPEEPKQKRPTTVTEQIKQRAEELYVNEEEEIGDTRRILLAEFPGYETIINHELNVIQNDLRPNEEISREIAAEARRLYGVSMPLENIRTILQEEYPDPKDVAAIDSAMAALQARRIEEGKKPIMIATHRIAAEAQKLREEGKSTEDARAIIFKQYSNMPPPIVNEIIEKTFPLKEALAALLKPWNESGKVPGKKKFQDLLTLGAAIGVNEEQIIGAFEGQNQRMKVAEMQLTTICLGAFEQKERPNIYAIKKFLPFFQGDQGKFECFVNQLRAQLQEKQQPRRQVLLDQIRTGEGIALANTFRFFFGIDSPPQSTGGLMGQKKKLEKMDKRVNRVINTVKKCWEDMQLQP
ncbi:MAG: hypothetical protein LBJ81_00290 [Puniceicoccales bacterium]|jgi:hypothetical protein|nr:hypothetical protein [Puniceicoccales bacterium]